LTVWNGFIFPLVLTPSPEQRVPEFFKLNGTNGS
jgi:ABC-type glycerol-3-phosphate transport system permease component